MAQFVARFFQPPARGQCQAQIEARQGVPRVERERPPGGGNRVLVAARRKAGFGEVVVRVDVSREERNEVLVALDRLLDSPQSSQGDAAILQRADETGIDRECAIVAIKGTGEIAEDSAP